jgi:hypothetical protein
LLPAPPPCGGIGGDDSASILSQIIGRNARPRQKVSDRDAIATAPRIAHQTRIFLFAILAGRQVFA